MKAFAIALMFVLAVAAAEEHQDSTGARKLGPTVINKIVIKLHPLLNQLEQLIQVLEPHLKPPTLKPTIGKLAKIISMIPEAVGVDTDIDIVQLSNAYADILVTAVQLALGLAKTALLSLKMRV